MSRNGAKGRGDRWGGARDTQGERKSSWEYSVTTSAGAATDRGWGRSGGRVELHGGYRRGGGHNEYSGDMGESEFDDSHECGEGNK
jgi:hypothetical protein